MIDVQGGDHNPDQCPKCQECIHQLVAEIFDIYVGIFGSFPWNVVIRLTTDQEGFAGTYTERIFLIGARIVGDTYKSFTSESPHHQLVMDLAVMRAKNDFRNHYETSLYKPSPETLDKFIQSIWEV